MPRSGLSPFSARLATRPWPRRCGRDGARSSPRCDSTWARRFPNRRPRRPSLRRSSPGRGRRARRRPARGQLYQDLLAARRRWPALRDRQHTVAQLIQDAQAAAAPGEPTMLMIRRGAEGELLAVANSRTRRRARWAGPVGRRPVLSTEDVRYGGARRLDRSLDTLGPYELVVFAPAGSVGEVLLAEDVRGEGAPDDGCQRQSIHAGASGGRRRGAAAGPAVLSSGGDVPGAIVPRHARFPRRGRSRPLSRRTGHQPLVRFALLQDALGEHARL